MKINLSFDNKEHYKIINEILISHSVLQNLINLISVLSQGSIQLLNKTLLFAWRNGETITFHENTYSPLKLHKEREGWKRKLRFYDF